MCTENFILTEIMRMGNIVKIRVRIREYLQVQAGVKKRLDRLASQEDVVLLESRDSFHLIKDFH